MPLVPLVSTLKAAISAFANFFAALEASKPSDTSEG